MISLCINITGLGIRQSAYLTPLLKYIFSSHSDEVDNEKRKETGQHDSKSKSTTCNKKIIFNPQPTSANGRLWYSPFALLWFLVDLDVRNLVPFLFAQVFGIAHIMLHLHGPQNVCIHRLRFPRKSRQIKIQHHQLKVLVCMFIF